MWYKKMKNNYLTDLDRIIRREKIRLASTYLYLKLCDHFGACRTYAMVFDIDLLKDQLYPSTLDEMIDEVLINEGIR
jgi:hypothetical protein